MERLRGFGRRFRFPWRSTRQVRRDVDDELAFHLAEKTQALQRDGLSPDDAREEALRQFGDVDTARRELIEEDRRGERRRMLSRTVDDLVRDTRFACRSLTRSPMFSLVAVFVLAIGIGVLSMMFNLIAIFAFPPALVEDPAALRAIYSRDVDRPGNWPSFSFAEYEAMRERSDALSSIAAYEIDAAGILVGDLTERALAAFVSANYFQTLGVPLGRGRTFTPAEEVGDDPATVVISHELWTRLGSDPEVLGSSLVVNGEPLVIVGVAPQRFTGTVRLLAPQIWLPPTYVERAAVAAAGADSLQPEARDLMLVGRLADGADDDGLATDLEALAAQTGAMNLGPDNTRYTYLATAVPKMSISNAPEGNESLLVPIVLLIGMGSVVLVIACLNLANMLLARGAGREVEMAIRRSLGSGRLRLIRQLLTEGLLLSVLGGLGGFFAAFGITRWLAAVAEGLTPAGFNLLIDVRLDARAALATAAVCFVATLLFALGPAWRITGHHLVAGLKLGAGAGGPHARPARRRFLAPRRLMIVAQIALSLVMLVAGGLFLRASAIASNKTPGFALESSLIAEIDPALIGYDERRSRELLRRLLARLRALPEIEDAATTSLVPFTGIARNAGIQPAGSALGAEVIRAANYAVSDGYFDAVRLPLLRGRDFTPGEAHVEGGPRVAIIDETAAGQLFPGEVALGRFVQFRVGRPDDAPLQMEIVGIAPAKLHRLNEVSPPPHIYRPTAQADQAEVFIHLAVDRQIADQEAVLDTVRAAIREVDPDLPILSLSTLRDMLDTNPNLWIVRFGGMLFMWLGLAALFLALVGVYGVTAFLISQRTREFGVRMALGASRRRLTWQILSEHMRTAFFGLTVGLGLAIVVGRLLGGLLFEISGIDPFVLAVSTALLAAAAMLAAYLPVRRASRIEPTAALRYE